MIFKNCIYSCNNHPSQDTEHDNYIFNNLRIVLLGYIERGPCVFRKVSEYLFVGKNKSSMSMVKKGI